MLAFNSELFSWIACRFRSRADLELEVIALRHQLAVLRRQRPGRARLSTAEARPRPALHSRSLNLGLALPDVAAVPERHRIGETGHRGSMAPTLSSAKT